MAGFGTPDEPIRAGQRFAWSFSDSPASTNEATVTRVLSDQQEGLAPEAEDYAALWIEALGTSGQHAGEAFTLMRGEDQRSYLEGKEVVIRSNSNPDRGDAA